VNWLELTTVADGEAIYVNMDQVVRISECKWQHGVGSTLLTLSVNKDGVGLLIDVREAPSEILSPTARRQQSRIKGNSPRSRSQGGAS
jgi:hypothetical protein